QEQPEEKKVAVTRSSDCRPRKIQKVPAASETSSRFSPTFFDEWLRLAGATRREKGGSDAFKRLPAEDNEGVETEQ
ncbi:MAG: hypothetical protein V5A41_09115, partial [Haloarculaceae archaeon]